ncbi:MAG TPA: pyridoxal-phosphate dependent enzyme [Caulobacteraceae bacterium]|nr:pyridoxal-phosphate dependent enzyme [Caulobacteraceae bacterium]
MTIADAAPAISFVDIEAARVRIAGKVRRTPVLANADLDAAARARLFFKCENLQEIGAFKARGATNAVFALTDAEAALGVATHSSGNHGAAVARAAALRGVAAHVVMPRNVSAPKAAQVERLGALITLCEPTLAAREAMVAKIIAETGARLVHPYDDPLVMAGQGTAALELLEDAPDLDLVLVPVGGGGLIGGTATAVKAMRPAARVIGVEPAGADDAARSFRAGRRLAGDAPSTIADGLRAELSQRTFATIRAHVDDVVTVSEAGIVEAMRAIWETLKVIVEPSAAVPLAAIREGALEVAGLKVGIILTGGNVDLDHLPW